ncbi:MAG: hypothetical protein K2P93_02905 [Alphaproteobacteria bacterium]|nr:hypothetical protein [Alphaproteobacteria bacterium]
MRLRISSMLAGGVMFSTTLEATDLKEISSSTPKQNPPKEHSSRDDLKTLKAAHHFNEIFDNYGTGGLGYEPF